MVVDLDAVGGLRAVAGASLDFTENETRFGLHGALFTGLLGQETVGGTGFGGGGLLHTLLGEGLDAGHDGFHVELGGVAPLQNAVGNALLHLGQLSLGQTKGGELTGNGHAEGVEHLVLAGFGRAFGGRGLGTSGAGKQPEGTGGGHQNHRQLAGDRVRNHVLPF